MFLKLKNILMSDFVKNTGWMVFAQIYQMGISLIVGVLCARYLGPTNYGLINYAASFVSFFAIVSALGVEGIVVRDIVKDRDIEGEVLGSAMLLKFFAGVLSMAAILVLVVVLNPDDEVLLTVAFLQSLALLFNGVQIIENWYQSYMRSKVPSVVKCAAYTFVSIYKILLLVSGKSVEWFAFASSLDAALIAMFLAFCYRKDSAQRLHVSIATMRSLISRGYHLLISSIMAVIYSQMDRIMIGQMIDMTQVGLYTAASTICGMWTFVPKALADSARPIIMASKDVDQDKYLAQLSRLISATFWVGVVFSVAITCFSSLIVSVLFGDDYAGAAYPLVIMIWSTIFSSLSYPRAIWMICEDKQSYNKKILAWGLVTNLLLNFILIPVMGIAGAAIATLVTEVVCCLIAPLAYKETRIFVKYLLNAMPPSRIITKNQ